MYVTLHSHSSSNMHTIFSQKKAHLSAPSGQRSIISRPSVTFPLNLALIMCLFLIANFRVMHAVTKFHQTAPHLVCSESLHVRMHHLFFNSLLKFCYPEIDLIHNKEMVHSSPFAFSHIFFIQLMSCSGSRCAASSCPSRMLRRGATSSNCRERGNCYKCLWRLQR
jgi:hypothetical protein